jgi:hypothetical protein
MKQINPEIETIWSRRLMVDAAAACNIAAVGSVRRLDHTEMEIIRYKLRLEEKLKKEDRQMTKCFNIITDLLK